MKTTIKSFRNNFDYIDFITSEEIKDGELLCSTFIPSAFFPKDVIDYYFNKKEHIDKHRDAADKLWNHGKKVLKKLKEGKIEICIEFQSIKNFIEKGLVHEATENFEASLITRIHVIDSILLFWDKIYLIPEPTPFVFRLIPDDIVIIDVDRNKTEQTIQGIAIKDIQLYNDFKEEYNRLRQSSINNVNKVNMTKILAEAKIKLKAGVRPSIKIH